MTDQIKAERDYTPEQIKAGATALYASGVTVPEGVSYAEVVVEVAEAVRVSTSPVASEGGDPS